MQPNTTSINYNFKQFPATCFGR